MLLLPGALPVHFKGVNVDCSPWKLKWDILPFNSYRFESGRWIVEGVFYSFYSFFFFVISFEVGKHPMVHSCRRVGRVGRSHPLFFSLFQIENTSLVSSFGR